MITGDTTTETGSKELDGKLVNLQIDGGFKNGIITGFHTARPDCVQVVFNCDGNWHDVTNYRHNEELVRLEDLNTGWK